MKFSFSKKVSYNAPEGEHTGWLHNIEYDPDRKWKSRRDSEARFTFFLKTDDRLIQYAVARNFCLDCGQRDELQQFLESWLGPDLEQFIDNHGDVDLDLLIEYPALLYVVHRPSRNGKHTNPFCQIVDIARAPNRSDQKAA